MPPLPRKDEGMKVSLSGMLKRLPMNKYESFGVEEFLKHYTEAKEAHEKGDQQTVSEFFKLYVT